MAVAINIEVNYSRLYREVGGNVRPAKVVRSPSPKYTQAALQARIEGTVLLNVVVDVDGKVQNARVIRGLGYGLDEAAVQTVTQEWRFDPGTKDDKPVPVEIYIKVNFGLAPTPAK